MKACPVCLGSMWDEGFSSRCGECDCTGVVLDVPHAPEQYELGGRVFTVGRKRGGGWLVEVDEHGLMPADVVLLLGFLLDAEPEVER